jgi:nucleoside-diphosphate-sugar epimerase
VLVVVSSIAAAGPTRRGSVKPDDAIPNPVSHYGRSKRAGELAAARLADRVPTTVVRPGIVFGPGDKDLLPMFRSVRRWHVHAIAGLSSPPLSLIHVTDLVELLERAAQQGQRLSVAEQDGSCRQGYYFACRPEYPDYLEFGRLLHAAVGNRFTAYLHFPPPIPWLCGGVGEAFGRLRGRACSLNVDKIREATADSWACSCAAAQRDLSYVPRQSLGEQLRLTAQWYRQQGWL